MKIILAVDGSRYSDWAVDLLLRLPLAKEPEISVLHVVDLVALKGPLRSFKYRRLMRKEVDRSLAAADRITARAVDRLSMRWQKTQAAVEKGDVAERIIARAQKEKADLIILGSRGISDIQSFLMGSVSYKVAAYAPYSVLVVKRKTPKLKKFLVSVDGSKHSANAVKFLKNHFLPMGIYVSVLSVWNPPFIPQRLIATTIEKKESKVLLGAGFKVKALSVRGHPGRTIVEFGRQKQVDFVIVGSRGLNAVKAFFLGSVSHKVVKYSHSSVLVVR